jgi:ribosome-binding protein aMBF1 (putative translation factor)
MSELYCQVCAQPANPLFTISSGNGFLNVCRDCKKLNPTEHYNLMIKRCEDLIAEARLQYNQDYRDNDLEGMQQMKNVIELAEKSKARLHKPCARD